MASHRLSCASANSLPVWSVLFSPLLMEIDPHQLLRFLEPQIRDFGGNVEVDDGLWTLFAVAASDGEANALAGALLSDVPFAHEVGASEDDRWTLYYVDTANRWPAVHWLDDLHKTAAGEIRPLSPAQQALLREIIDSDKPHRIAQQLAEMHTRGEISAGVFSDPTTVRSLLDRLHQREPLFFSAFLTLLTHHLIDLVVLLRRLISEDVALENEIVKGGLSRDPFLQSRQDAAAEIRNTLLRFHLINRIDQQKNSAITNPYMVYLEVVRNGDQIAAPIGGTVVNVPLRNFLNAIHAIRRNLYRGDKFSSFDTQMPWMTDEIAYAFRFIKQCADSHSEFTPIDTLYMLERAVEL